MKSISNLNLTLTAGAKGAGMPADGKPEYKYTDPDDGEGVAELTLNVNGKQILGFDKDSFGPEGFAKGVMSLWIDVANNGDDDYRYAVSTKKMAKELRKLADALDKA